MQHASTSPFYPLFASLDVGAQMMKGRSGEVLWDDTIRLGIELRKKIRAVRREFEDKEKDPARRWFFDPFVPDRVDIPDAARSGAHHVAWESVSTDQLSRRRPLLGARAGRRLARLRQLAPGFAMTDPNKLTLLTPGFDRGTGGYADHGIPAPVVAQYLRENRIVPEKNDLNSLLFLLTPGVEASKAGTLISALVAFKRLHDDNALLEDVIPEFVARRPQRYAGVRLRDLCGEMHRFFREANVSALQARSSRPSTCPRSRCRRARPICVSCATMSTTCRSTRSRGASAHLGARVVRVAQDLEHPRRERLVGVRRVAHDLDEHRLPLAARARPLVEGHDARDARVVGLEVPAATVAPDDAGELGPAAREHVHHPPLGPLGAEPGDQRHAVAVERRARGSAPARRRRRRRPRAPRSRSRPGGRG